jgi:hypothetical protein
MLDPLIVLTHYIFRPRPEHPLYPPAVERGNLLDAFRFNDHTEKPVGRTASSLPAEGATWRPMQSLPRDKLGQPGWNSDMPDYHYRSNPDGTTDSICCACFWTIATAETFHDLKAAEKAHTCGPGQSEQGRRNSLQKSPAIHVKGRQELSSRT